MYINRIVIKNFRAIRSATVDFKDGVNVIVGDNEAGKSTLLQAIHAALTGRLGGRSLRYQLHPFLFNRSVAAEFAAAVAAKKSPSPPEILIEVYFDDDDALVRLKGTNNSRKEEATGVSLRICVEEGCAEDFAAYVNGSTDDTELVPVEFFGVEWQSFAYAPMNARMMPFKSRLIDTAGSDAGRGAGRYLSQVVEDCLSRKDRIDLALAFRAMKRKFEQAESIGRINSLLGTRQGGLSEKVMALAMDVSSSGEWGEGVVPILDGIPFDLVGRGEQSAASIWLAVDGASHAHLVMIEEPENHLSFGKLNAVISRAAAQTAGRQLIVTTHSSFVVNKLGLSDLLLFSTSGCTRLTDISEDTTNFFRRLPGHDTLRLVLAKRVVLVEGPSDELIVQRAYLDRHGKRPIEQGVDVLSVGNSFKRYLSIAQKLVKTVSVLTDNDGDAAAIKARYKDYDGIAHIRVCVSDQADGSTLEPQIVACNSLDTIQSVLKQQFTDQAAATKWMLKHKTEAAILIHDADQRLVYPKYVIDAIS